MDTGGTNTGGKTTGGTDDLEFAVTRRGYDPEQVRAFARSVAQQMTRLKKQNDDLMHHLDKANAEAPRQRTDVLDMWGEETNQILDAARETVARVTAKAKEDAQRILAEAERDAKLLRKQAQADHDTLISEADTHVKHVTATADAYAARTVAEADVAAEQTRADAEAFAVDQRSAAADDAERIAQLMQTLQRDLADLIERHSGAQPAADNLADAVSGH